MYIVYSIYMAPERGPSALSRAAHREPLPSPSPALAPAPPPHPCTPHLHHPNQYFAHSAKLYAAEVGVEESEANQTFASLFAFTLLSVEVVLKLFPVLLLPIATETVVIYPG